MGISATYLSRVENDVDPRSAELIFKISRLYGRPIEEFNAAARRPAVTAEARGREIQSSEELRALYRMGEMLTCDELEDIIRAVLKKRGLSDDDVERELARLRSELPRIRNAQGDGLYAADIKPRFLSKGFITSKAYQLLAANGLSESTYEPPTPIELLVDSQDGVSYKIADLASQRGAPVVLGLTKWNGPSERQIVINSALADGTSSTDEHRFNFTLAHELFHAIEHLPLGRAAAGASLMRFRLETVVFVERDPSMPRRSAAQRAVERWANSQRTTALLTDEDWREWQANAFASALLMPASVTQEFHNRIQAEFVAVPEDGNVREEALNIAGEILFNDVVYEKSLADLFAVSRQAMAIRLLDLCLIREVPG